jgi:hypothetical protein
MRPIGFSTGALARHDARKALGMLAGSRASAVELSALREGEFIHLIDLIGQFNFTDFEFVCFHAPSNLVALTERDLVASLDPILERGWPVIVHPNVIQDQGLWTHLGSLLCIENMDGRKRAGRNVDELLALFDKLPTASFCLDVGHARHVDRTMSQAEMLVHELGARLRLVHLSEVDLKGRHVALSLMALLSFSRIADTIPCTCPVIIESPLEDLDADAEIARVNTYFSCRSRPTESAAFTFA